MEIIPDAVEASIVASTCEMSFFFRLFLIAVELSMISNTQILDSLLDIFTSICDWIPRRILASLLAILS